MSANSKVRKTIQFKLSLEEYEVYRFYFQHLNGQEEILGHITGRDVPTLDTTHNLNKPAELVLSALVKHRVTLKSPGERSDSDDQPSDTARVTPDESTTQELKYLRGEVESLNAELTALKSHISEYESKPTLKPSDKLAKLTAGYEGLQTAHNKLKEEFSKVNAERDDLKVERGAIVNDLKLVHDDKERCEQELENLAEAMDAQKRLVDEQFEKINQYEKGHAESLRELEERHEKTCKKLNQAYIDSIRLETRYAQTLEDTLPKSHPEVEIQGRQMVFPCGGDGCKSTIMLPLAGEYARGMSIRCGACNFVNDIPGRRNIDWPDPPSQWLKEGGSWE